MSDQQHWPPTDAEAQWDPDERSERVQDRGSRTDVRGCRGRGVKLGGQGMGTRSLEKGVV